MKTEKQLETEFFNLVSEIMIHTPGELSKFQQSLSMVSTLIQDKKLDDLIMVLRLHFPEYFNDHKPFRI